ncbi:Protein of unknown function DUF1635 [Dillenia turbinata]|uniref:Uncharacterized protein n=1 Tax=Dillenia turbinata TaxID=194707 RepID=A0AAN8ZD17_9MAGN
MDNQRSPLLSLAYFYQGKGMEELRQSLLYTTQELEATRLIALEELRRRDDQLSHLKEMLCRAIRERDEAQEKCQRLLLEKLILQHHQQQQNLQTAPLSGISSIEDDPRRGLDSNNGFSSSDCDESIVSSPVMDQILQPQPQLSTLPPLPPPLPPPAQPSQPLISIHEADIELVPEKPLPEKGKLLQAVMKAGPLLQTLLLAGPLPQWRHPPPPIDSYEIPPVTIPSPPPQHIPQQDPLVNTSLCTAAATANNCARANKKRALCEEAGSPLETNKYPRVVLH